MKKVFLICVLTSLLIGCSQRIHPAFYDVVQDHRQLLQETNDAVIGSIQAELESARDRLSDEQIKSIENLIERLEFLKAQGVVIEQYVEDEYVDEDLIAELLRYRWSQQQE